VTGTTTATALEGQDIARMLQGWMEAANNCKLLHSRSCNLPFAIDDMIVMKNDSVAD
jgi:hypothetical protein